MGGRAGIDVSQICLPPQQGREPDAQKNEIDVCCRTATGVVEAAGRINEDRSIICQFCMSTITIHPMVEHADEVPRIATWFFEEWRSLYGEESQVSVQGRIKSWLTRNEIPTALVAVSDGHVVGTVVLEEKELQHPSFSPWLAGLFVVPECRHKGIGALLVHAAESEAAILGVQQLYLYTPASQGYYEHLGWSLIENCQLPSGSVAVMGKGLQHYSQAGRTRRVCA